MYITAVALTISFRLLPSTPAPCWRKCGRDIYAAVVKSRIGSRSQIQHKVMGLLTKMMQPRLGFPLILDGHLNLNCTTLHRQRGLRHRVFDSDEGLLINLNASRPTLASILLPTALSAAAVL